ncbi:hypothetical protein EI94DRAFT_320455 [Lactarius quietus]|nr:hypothetical protein EI94DRAFT_320455 [Lactarius quietus]
MRHGAHGACPVTENTSGRFTHPTDLNSLSTQTMSTPRSSTTSIPVSLPSFSELLVSMGSPRCVQCQRLPHI